MSLRLSVSSALNLTLSGSVGTFSVGTGFGEQKTIEVKYFLTHVGLDFRDHVEVDPHYFRPTEVQHLIGDASKARRTLGWEGRTRFASLVRIMVDADLAALQGQTPGAR